MRLKKDYRDIVRREADKERKRFVCRGAQIRPHERQEQAPALQRLWEINKPILEPFESINPNAVCSAPREYKVQFKTEEKIIHAQTNAKNHHSDFCLLRRPAFVSKYMQCKCGILSVAHTSH